MNPNMNQPFTLLGSATEGRGGVGLWSWPCLFYGLEIVLGAVRGEKSPNARSSTTVGDGALRFVRQTPNPNQMHKQLAWLLRC